MISFDFSFHSSDPLHGLTALLLVSFPLVVTFVLWKNKTLPLRRKWLRGGLNMLLWLVLLGYFLQPTWTTSTDTRRALLIATDVPAAIARQWQDSLGLNERFGAQEFLKKKLAPHFDSVTLLGHDFPLSLLAQITAGALDWQPYYSENQIQNLGWQGILRQGEMQRISGVVHTTSEPWVKIKFAGTTLDSTQLVQGKKTFSLNFPTFTEGRTSTELFINDEFVDTLRFFVRPQPVFSYQFMLNSPDFESRTLAEWLGQRGNPVTLTTTVSKGIQQSIRLNGGVSKGTLPDLIITDPSNAGSSAVKKALVAGKSILFIGLTQAEANIATLNRALQTGFSVKRITSESTTELAGGLTALPYTFNETLPQLIAPHYPVAVWHKTGRVGVSLLNETFPLKLRGDSAAYAKVWNTILAQVQPPFLPTITAEAPLFAGQFGTIALNAAEEVSARLQVGKDTVLLQPSPLNERSASIAYLMGKSGWISVGDSAEVFVADSTSVFYPAHRLNDYVKAQRAVRASTVKSDPKPQRQEKVTDWVWLVLIVASCTALWLEPKL